MPWVGFTRLPPNVDAAAKLSRTVACQRERVRRWVAREGGDLLAEEVVLELAPDRGSEHVGPTVDRLLGRARAECARLVLVNFSEAYGWRKHAPLRERLAAHPDLHVLLDPEPPLSAKSGRFDPVEHVRAWREVEARHVAGKPRRKAALASAIARRQAEHPSLAGLAQAHNADNLTTPTGKPWSAENLRKFMQGI